MGAASYEMSTGWCVVQCKAWFSYGFSFSGRHWGLYKRTCCPWDVFPRTWQRAKMQRASGEGDVGRRSRARLGVALYPAELAALLPAPPHQRQLPVLCPVLDATLLPRGGGGSGRVGIRWNQQYLEGGFALGVHFGPLSLWSRCCDFCWSWKTNFRGGEFQPEELAALLEALSHAPNLSIELSN